MGRAGPGGGIVAGLWRLARGSGMDGLFRVHGRQPAVEFAASRLGTALWRRRTRLGQADDESVSANNLAT